LRGLRASVVLHALPRKWRQRWVQSSQCILYERLGQKNRIAPTTRNEVVAVLYSLKNEIIRV